MHAVKLDAHVDRSGKLSLPKLPLLKGKAVEVIVIERPETVDGLLHASESSLNFWDNSIDDAIWNDA